MAENYSVQDGRIWFQRKKFEPYTLLLPYGMGDVTDPTGSLNPVREPSAGARRSSRVVDILRGEPGLPGFTITTRLRKTKNYLMGLRTRGVNFQCHMGQCGRPDRYDASEIGFQWNHVLRGDLSIGSLAQIQGDNAPDEVSVPFMARTGPLPADFEVEFLSARSIGEIEDITDIAMIVEACDDISVQYDPGDNGYLVTNAATGSPAALADVWFTENAGESWARVSSDPTPFGAGESIPCVVVQGEKTDHRVIVPRGTADAGNPAEIAYADVTDMGTVTWVYVNVGAVNGQYINYMYWLSWDKLLAVTNDGYVYRSANGGVTWTAVLTTAAVALHDVAMLADGTAWVCGASGYLAFSESFGDSWSQKTVLDSDGDAVTATINTLAVTPDGTVIVGTNAGGQYGSYDDGATWTTLPLQGITATDVKRIRAADDDNIWTIANLGDGSGRALRSTDGGAQFLLWSLNMPSNSGLNGLAVVDHNLVFVVGDYHATNARAFVSRTDPQIIGF